MAFSFPAPGAISHAEKLSAISKSFASALNTTDKKFKALYDPKRVYGTENFILSSNSSHDESPVIDLSVTEQEKLLAKDLLYLLSGITPTLISVHSISSNKVDFIVDSSIDPSLKDLTLQIAKCAGYYYTVQKYVENYCNFEYGKVHHALVAAIKIYIHEYRIHISQLENTFHQGNLPLQNFWFFMQKDKEQLSIMSSIVLSIEEKGARGGQVLTILHEKAVTFVGNENGKNLCEGLAKSASQPYFRLLENWIYKGVIHDPFNEFFISEGILGQALDYDNEIEVSNSYWDKHYKKDILKCPSFLHKIENEIMKAGKYLNVIRQCGQEVSLYRGSTISYSTHEHIYIDSIQTAYQFASKSLLKLLLKDYDLMKRIDSVKHYLLMDQGDFIVQFLDLTEEELCKDVNDLNETRLSSLLEMALRTSSSCTDPYKDSVKVQLFPNGIREMLEYISVIGTPLEKAPTTPDAIISSIPGIEAFSLKFEVKWPISLVLNERVVTNYQLIFRHLFLCKHVERRLCQAWIEGKKFKKLQSKEFGERYAAFSLRQKMLNFVQNIQYYMAFEVIEPAWHTFIATMSKVQNIDQVMDAHYAFLSSIVHDSLLTLPDLLDKIIALLTYCLNFSMKFILRPKDVKNSHFSTSRFNEMAHLTKSPSAPAPYNNKASVFECEKEFTDLLVQFLKDVSKIVHNPNQSSKVVNIIHRINFNGYYSQALG